MKIINLLSEVDMEPTIGDLSEFILDVIRPTELEHYQKGDYLPVNPVELLYEDSFDDPIPPMAPVRKFIWEGHENIATLLHTIPIYFRYGAPNEEDDDDNVDGSGKVYADRITDQFGAYVFNRKGESPYIELYLRDIEDAAEDDQEFKWVFAIALLHALAHAAMDIYNRECVDEGQDEKVAYTTEFGRWREESMANAATLRVIKDFGDEDFYDFAEQLMLSQPPEYALGVKMVDFYDSDFDSVGDGKERGVNPALQDEWLNYVKNGNPDMAGLQNWNRVLASKRSYLLDGNYYEDETKLVHAIVDKVTSDYERENGRKMSADEFKSVFPLMKVGYGMSFEVARPEDEGTYKKLVKLSDVTYSLFDDWDCDSLHQFVEKSGCKFTEFENYKPKYSE